MSFFGSFVRCCSEYLRNAPTLRTFNFTPANIVPAKAIKARARLLDVAEATEISIFEANIDNSVYPYIAFDEGSAAPRIPGP